MSYREVDFEKSYIIPFSHIGRFFQFILLVSIATSFIAWFLLSYSGIMIKALVLYLIVSMVFLSYWFLATLLLLISGNGSTELLITSDSILLKKTFYPFFMKYFQRVTLRKASIKDIEFLESSRQSIPNFGIVFAGLLLFAIGFTTLLLDVFFQLNLSVVVGLSMVLGIMLILYSILFSRKDFYQFKIVFKRPGLFFPFFEFIGNHFLSSGVWVVRGRLGDARKLFEEGQSVISSQQSQ